MDQGYIPPPLPTQPQHAPVKYDPPGRRRQSMLAWWAALPLIPFAIVESIFGWPIAVARTTSVDFTISFFGGSVLGGLLIPLVVAFIVYRIRSKSQFAGSLAFTIMLMLVCASVYRQASSDRRNADMLAASMLPRIQTFTAFEFETAGGWQQIRASHDGNLATLVLDGPSRSDPNGMIMVDAGKPIADLRQTAASLAEADGRVLPDPVLIDGVQGVRVETTSTDTSRPKLAVLVLRGRRIYLIMAAGSHGYDVTPDFEHVLKTWKWKD